MWNPRRPHSNCMIASCGMNRVPAPETPHPVQRPRLVGRHAEWQQLQRIWRTAQAGTAQVILIWGEAGIGKTRLAQEMLDWVGRQGHGCASARSYAARGALAYAPVAEWLRSERDSAGTRIPQRFVARRTCAAVAGTGARAPASAAARPAGGKLATTTFFSGCYRGRQGHIDPAAPPPGRHAVERRRVVASATLPAARRSPAPAAPDRHHPHGRCRDECAASRTGGGVAPCRPTHGADLGAAFAIGDGGAGRADGRRVAGAGSGGNALHCQRGAPALPRGDGARWPGECLGPDRIE